MADDLLIRLGDRIRNLRKKRGWTQVEMASGWGLIGVSWRIWKGENGMFRYFFRLGDRRFPTSSKDLEVTLAQIVFANLAAQEARRSRGNMTN